jgi:hypothetical protein
MMSMPDRVKGHTGGISCISLEANLLYGALTGDGCLPLQETQTFFVDDPGKLYRQRRRATQAKGLETLDSEAEVEGLPESPRESPPPSPKEDQPKPTSLIYLS